MAIFLLGLTCAGVACCVGLLWLVVEKLAVIQVTLDAIRGDAP